MKRSTWLMLGALTLSGTTGCVAEEILPCFDSCCDWDPCSMPYALNPPIVCPTSGCCSWTGSLEFLYWRPFIENNTAAQVLILDGYSRTREINNSSHFTCVQKDFKYDWDSGFRVGIGYSFPCDRWGVNLAWTHYLTDASFTDEGFIKSTVVGFNTFFTGAMPFPSNLDASELIDIIFSEENGSLAAKWHFQFNQIDLDIARQFYVGCALSVKPYLGLRMLLVKNRQFTEASYETFRLRDPSQDRAYNLKLWSDFKGLGLKAGLECHYELFCGLGIYGNADSALLFTEYHINNTLDRVMPASNKHRHFNRHEAPFSYHALRFMTDLALGIEWREPINCNQSLLVLKAGWEHHLIVGGHRFNKTDTVFNGITNHVSGDISLYGLVFSIGLSF